jgi:hypothetical protein
MKRRHDFNRAHWLQCRRGGRMAEPVPAPSPVLSEVEGPPLAELLPPPPVLSAVEGPRPVPRPVVKLNLRDAPSSMEQRAESWRAKGA